MFMLQYQMPGGESRMQEVEASHAKMVWYLAQFEHPIVAVYENGNVVTKQMRKELAAWPGSKTNYARAFEVI